MHPDYDSWNAESLVSNPSSIYHHWRNILSLRKSHKDIFVYGSFVMVDPTNEHVFAYLREYGSEAALVVTNFSDRTVEWQLPEEVAGRRQTQVLAATYVGEEKGPGEPTRVGKRGWSLRPYEAFVVLLDS